MESFVLDNVEVHPGLNLVKRGGREVRLTPKETAVLLHLVRASEGIATRQQLLDAVWGDVIVREDAPTLAISRLRRALGDDRRNPRFIETIPKVGYRLLVSPGQPVSSAARESVRRLGDSGKSGDIGPPGKVRPPGHVRSPDDVRPPRRVHWVPIVLGVLLLVMTVLFWSARSAYEEASTEAEFGQTGTSEHESLSPE